MRRHPTKAFILSLVVCLVLATGVGAGPVQPSPPARMEVSGYGFFGNRSLLKMLRLLQPPGKAPSTYTANAVEDAAMVLLSQLARDGYLDPKLTVSLTLTDGMVLVRHWDESLEPLLPRPLEARRVCFRIHRGVLFYYGKITFVGLDSELRVPARSVSIWESRNVGEARTPGNPHGAATASSCPRLWLSPNGLWRRQPSSRARLR